MRKIVMFLLLMGLTLPAHAFDISIPNGFLNLYGSIRLGLNYQLLSQGQPPVDVDTTSPNLDSSALLFGMQPKSRVGMDVNFSNYFGKAELAVSPDLNNPGLYFRQYYAGAKFNYMYFLAGRKMTDADTSSYYNDIFLDDGGLAGFGTVAMSIRTLVQYSIIGIKFSIVSITEDMQQLRYVVADNNGTVVDKENTITAASSNVLPRLDLAYGINVNEALIRLFGSFSMVNTIHTQSKTEATTTAFTTGVLVSGTINPGFGLGYLTVSGFFSMNGGLLGQVKVGNIYNGIYSTNNMTPLPVFTDGNYTGLSNILTFGFAGSLQYFLTPSMFLELGGGYQSSSSDAFLTYNPDLNNNEQDKNEPSSVDSLAVYLQFSWEVADGLFLVPQGGLYMRTTGFYSPKYKNDSRSYMLDATAILAGLQVKYEF